MDAFECKMKIWKRKRRNMTIFAMLEIFFIGLECFSIFTTLIYYLRDTMKIHEPSFWYGVVLSASVVSEGLGSLVLGKYMDKTRNSKVIILFTLSLALFGNILYTLQYNVWLLIVGRFMCGFLPATQPVIVGEFRRCFNNKEFSKVISLYQLIFIIGFNMAPVSSTLVVRDINFTLGTWHVDKYSAIGLVLAFFSLFFLLSACLFLSDVSKEYDLLKKEALDFPPDQIQQYIEAEECSMFEQNDPVKGESSKLLNWTNFFRCEILLILIVYLLIRFTISLVEPLLYTNMSLIFRWSLDKLSLLISIVGVSFCVIALLLFKINVFSGRCRLFFFFVLCIIGSVLMLVSSILPSVITELLLHIQVMYFVAIQFSLFLIFTAVTIVVRSILLNIVPHHSASYMDGVTNAVGTTGRAFGSFVTGYVFWYSGYILPTISIVMVILAFVLLMKRKKYIL